MIKFDPTTNKTTLFGEDQGTATQKWHNPVAVGDSIYVMPVFLSPTSVIKYDIVTKETKYIESPLITNNGKIANGLLAGNGCIYMIPIGSVSGSIHPYLKLNTTTDVVTQIGENFKFGDTQG